MSDYNPKIKEAQYPPRTDCAYMGCGNTAILKMRVGTTSWSNLCEHHYDMHMLSIAQETCKRLGLNTTEQKRAYVLDKLKATTFLKMPEREPGED